MIIDKNRGISLALTLIASFVFLAIIEDYVVNDALPQWIITFNDSSVGRRHFIVADAIAIIITFIFGAAFYKFYLNRIYQLADSSLNKKYIVSRRIAVFQWMTFGFCVNSIYYSNELTVTIIFSCLMAVNVLYFIFDYNYAPDWLNTNSESLEPSWKKILWSWRFILFLLLYALVMGRLNEVLPNILNIYDFYSAP
jgi:hypothetical protein